MITNINPYNDYFEATPNNFIGRNDELWELIQDLARPHGQSHIEIIGLPEIGKSRLISHLNYILSFEEKPNDKKRNWQNELKRKYNYISPENVLITQVDFRKIPFDTHPFFFLYNTFQNTYSSFLLETRRSLRPLPEIKPIEKFNNTDEIIRQISTDITLLSEKSFRTIFLLDDFDKIFENQKVTKNEVNLLRSLRDQVSIVLLTEQSIAKSHPDIASSPFFQSMPLRYLGRLKESDIREFIELPADKNGVTIPEADMEFISDISGGFPYLLILTAQSVWDVRSELKILNKDIPLTKLYKDSLAGKLKSDFQRSLRIYWDLLEIPEQKALRDLYTDPTIKTQEIVETFGLLRKKGILKGDLNNSIKFFSPLLEWFIQSPVTNSQLTAKQSENDITLTLIEKNLFNYLKNNQDRVCTYEELLSNVWNDTSEHRHVIQTAISRLRKKLKRIDAGKIQLESNVGYRYYL